MARKSKHGPIGLDSYRWARSCFLNAARKERAAMDALGAPHDGVVWLAAKHRKALTQAQRNLAEIRLQYAEGLKPPRAARKSAVS